MNLQTRIKQLPQGFQLEVAINKASFAPLSASDGRPMVFESQAEARAECEDLQACFEVMTADYSQKPKDPKTVIQQMVLNF